jgi:predicted nucleic acid-binding protein
VVEEAESATLAAYLSAAASKGDRLVASMLLYTELHGAALYGTSRRGLPKELVTSVLSGINLADVARSDLLYAAALPGRLRSADAIHLAAAIRLQTDALIAYDGGLAAAATEAGLTALSPN